MFRPISQPLRTGAILLGAAALALGGCSNLSLGGGGREPSSSGGAYQSDRPRTSLEIPPDLSQEGLRDAYPIPGAASGGGRSGQNRAAVAVLPEVPEMRVERDGRLRRLVVEAEPSELWENVREFWRSQGFRLDLDSPETGTMETDWAEKREDLPVGQVRRALERFKRFAYQYSVRDRFRTRFERGAAPETTEIYVTHRGAHEVERGDGYGWSPRPSDPALEAEMIGRLMLFLGHDEASASAALASPEIVRPAAPNVEVVSAPSPDGRHLRIDEGFDRAWRLTALALDRAGFTVEDRDRGQGLFFVRYIDPEASSGKKRSWVSRLAFWSRDKDQGRPENTEFRIFLEDGGEGRTRIGVRDGQGQPADGETAGRILDVLADQLR